MLPFSYCGSQAPIRTSEVGLALSLDYQSNRFKIDFFVEVSMCFILIFVMVNRSGLSRHLASSLHDTFLTLAVTIFIAETMSAF